MWVQDKVWPSSRDFRWRLSIRGIRIDSEGVELDFVSWVGLFTLWLKIIRSGRMKKNVKTGVYGISQRALSGWVARQNIGWKGRHLGVLGPIYHRFCMIGCLKQRSQVIWVCPKMLQFLIVDSGVSSVESTDDSLEKSMKEGSQSDEKKKSFVKKTGNHKKDPSTPVKNSRQESAGKKKSFRKKTTGENSKPYTKQTSQKKRVPIMEKAPSSGGRKKKATRKKAPSQKRTEPS
ncbi:MAG: hypothetical protein AB8C84_01420 [Oligoflexales bacterium]